MARKYVTVALDEETARWARVEAARRDMSVSRTLGAMLRERMLESREFASAMRRYRPRRPGGISSGRPYPSRDSLHERSRLR